MAVTMKSLAFWVVKKCSSERIWCFGRTYCRHLQGKQGKIAKQETSFPPTFAGFLLGSLFEREAGSDMFLQNIEHWDLSELHGVTTQKTALFTI
jgi:uncharacterized protein YgiB involved in biofilm formation